MITYKNAIELIEKNTNQLPVEEIPLMDSLGCVIGKNIYTPKQIPMFDSSAVDGYAIRTKDVIKASKINPIKLRIQNFIQAGDTKKYSLNKNHTFKIFTGALVPKNVDAVLMLENVRREGDFIYVDKIPEPGENIRRKGEEYKKGQLLLKAGELLTPPIIGLLASAGIKNIPIIKKPRISIIVTGNELKQFDEDVLPGQIRDSNYPSLISALNAIGLSAVLVMNVKDSLNEIKNAIKKAFRISDIIITTGGVSIGDYDFVKLASEMIGFKEIFWKVAIKPGMPNYFAKKQDVLLFGLPGNPVAVLVSIEKFVKLAIRKMMGLNFKETTHYAILTSDLKKNTNRLEFVRGSYYQFGNGKFYVTPFYGRGSHMLGEIALANCFIHFPENKKILKKKSKVKISLIEWFKR